MLTTQRIVTVMHAVPKGGVARGIPQICHKIISLQICLNWDQDLCNLLSNSCNLLSKLHVKLGERQIQ